MHVRSPTAALDYHLGIPVNTMYMGNMRSFFLVLANAVFALQDICISVRQAMFVRVTSLNVFLKLV